MLTQPIFTKTGNLRTGTASFFRFLEVCNIPAHTAFPASDQLLSLWALWLSAEGKAYDTVKNYLYDISTYQIAGLGGPSINRCNLPLFNMALKDIKKQPRSGSPLVRFPIERRHLEVIRSALDISTPEGATIWAACCAAFYGLMRVAEFTTKDNHPFEPAWQAKRRDFSTGQDTNNRRDKVCRSEVLGYDPYTMYCSGVGADVGIAQKQFMY